MWHSTHTIKKQEHLPDHCTRCGLWLDIGEHSDNTREGYNYNEIALEPCRGARYFGRGGHPLFIPYDLPPKLKMPKFWKGIWCNCRVSISIGYDLARWRYTGLFCHACDSEYITSKEHCHCAVCGGVCQVG